MIGTPRTLDAALNITEALGIVIAVAEEEASKPRRRRGQRGETVRG